MSNDEAELIGRLGAKVSTKPATFPSKTETLQGRYVDLVPLAPEHAPSLFPLVGLAEHERLWDYMLDGPFDGDQESFQQHMGRTVQRDDMVFFAILDKTVVGDGNQPAKAVGYGSFLRIDPTNRVIEIGNLMFSHLLQRTRQSTEAIYLLASYAIRLGYRRIEWKCNNLNEPSKRAALRFGFTYEGLFRKAVIVKGRSRDTAWYSIIDDDWPARKAAFEAWLDPANFSDDGRQIRDLKSLRQQPE